MYEFMNLSRQDRLFFPWNEVVDGMIFNNPSSLTFCPHFDQANKALEQKCTARYQNTYPTSTIRTLRANRLKKAGYVPVRLCPIRISNCLAGPTSGLAPRASHTTT